MIEGVRLKNENAQPPGGYQFLQAETGQKKPFVGSIHAVAKQVVDLRKGNRHLSQKYSWATDLASVVEEVKDYNIRRCLAHHWDNFLVVTSMPTFVDSEPSAEPVKKNEPGKLASVVGVAKNLAGGVGAIVDWLGSGGKPVDRGLAENRASICVSCPQNGPGGFTEYFTVPAANLIREQLEIKHHLKIVTTHDEKLGVCKACLCPLKLKVHAPLAHILDHTTDKVRADLDPRCWILHEDSRADQKNAV